MSHSDYYEINVALKGVHYFATAERSIRDRTKLGEVYADLRRAFPPKDGYSFSVTKWESRGKRVSMGETDSMLDKESVK